MADMDIRNRIDELVYNVNSVDVKVVAAGIDGGEIGRDDVRMKLDDQTFRLLQGYLDSRHECVTLAPGLEKADLDWGRTEVYFWGLRDSGRTSVIGGILASQEGSIRVTDSVSGGRSAALAGIFGQKGAVCLDFKESGDEDYSIINVEIRDKHGYFHPLSLIDAKNVDIANANFHDTFIAGSPNDKIHILCYDITREGPEQDNAFMGLLGKLESSGVLGTSVGVYLLVTKADTLKFSTRIDLENTVQTKITASHVELWNRVSNICSGMEIHGVRPLPFSVGQVRMRRLVQLNLEYAADIVRYPLLAKSNSYRSRIVRVLTSGPAWLSALILFGAGAVVACVAYFALSENSPAPDAVIEPYSFEKDFMRREENDISGRSYDESYAAFTELYNSLVTESNIRLDDGSRLMDGSGIRKCESRLVNDFAVAVIDEFDRLESDSVWDARKLGELIWQKKDRLCKSKWLEKGYRDRLDECHKAVNDYKYAMGLISFSKVCDSREDVDSVLDKAPEYKYYPLYNCIEVKRGLEEAPENARMSYADFLYERARDVRDRYSRAGSSWKFWKSSAVQEQIRRDAQPLRDMINDFLYTLPEDSRARDRLLRARDLLP